MEEVVMEYKGRWYLVPREIVVETMEHNNRVDGCSYYTNGREFWGRYWTNSLAFDRCGCCGEFYTEFKNCNCDTDYFEISKEEFMKNAMELGMAREIPIDEARALQVVQGIKEIQKKLNELLTSVKDIEIREVKEFGNGAHVTLPKNLIGRKVLIIPL